MNGRRSLPTYFSHSYRPEDREINQFFLRKLSALGFALTVDPRSASTLTDTRPADNKSPIYVPNKYAGGYATPTPIATRPVPTTDRPIPDTPAAAQPAGRLTRGR